jgi:hypothetical protein
LGCWWLGLSPVIVASVGSMFARSSGSATTELSYYGLRGASFGPAGTSGRFSWTG